MEDTDITQSAARAGLDRACQQFPQEVKDAIANALASRAALVAIDDPGIVPWSPVAIVAEPAR